MDRLNYDIVDGDKHHVPAMLALAPELANFDIPEKRRPEYLYEGDQEMIERWAHGEHEAGFACVAVQGDAVLGYAFITMREELLSHAPSAHLEVLVVSPDARGKGLGEALSQAAEVEAAKRGATSITLHVFNKNTRARSLYEKRGYDEELFRCIKYL